MIAEYIDGDEVPMTFTYTDDTTTPPTKTNPGAATTIIKVGYDGVHDVTLALNNLTPVSPGVYSYVFDTTGLTVATGKKVECSVQTQGTMGVKCTSDPVQFRVLPRQS